MAQLTIEQALQIAVEHHQAGQLGRAEKIYRQILARQPKHADALHYLGMIAAQLGLHDGAAELIRQAVAVQPDYPQAWSNLGISLRAMGKLGDAIAAFRRAVALDPNSAAAHCNLGSAMKDKGDIAEAIAAYRRAIALTPGDAELHSNLGSALTDKGQLDEAIAACRKSIELNSNLPAGHINLGTALQAKGQLDEAIAAYRRAIAINPNFPQAHFNLGSGLQAMGRFDEAVAAYKHATALQPSHARTQFNLAISLKARGENDQAIAAYRQAIALEPDLAEAYLNLGNALKERGKLDEAIALYRRAIAIKPDFHDAHSNLILAMQYHPGFNAGAVAGEQREWNRRYAQPLGGISPFPGTPGKGWGEGASQYNAKDPHPNPLPAYREREPDRSQANSDHRLRIGYVSPDFRQHVVGRNLLPLFRNHDRKQFEIFCYSDAPRADEMTAEFQKHCDSWHNITNVSDENVAEQIRHDKIDILVDLALHTAHNRLLVFARKPAPVQATFAGYPGSTGLTAIDYRLSDPQLDPPGMDETVYSEKTLRLPDSFWCYDPLDGREIAVNALPARSAGIITFGCLNNFCKVNKTILSLWASIMGHVSRSRLLLLAEQGSHRKGTVEFLAGQGVDPVRVEFLDPQSRLRYLELYHRIDVALDSFPYNGHTTSLDSFWMGVPLVTLVGQTALSRAGWCQLCNLGLPELAGNTPDEFVRIAIELAGDIPRMAELRATLRQQMERSPLMDAPRFARSIEEAYRGMWQRHVS